MEVSSTYAPLLSFVAVAAQPPQKAAKASVAVNSAASAMGFERIFMGQI